MRTRTLRFCCILAAAILAMPAMRAADKAATGVHPKAASSNGVLAPPETLTGKIVMVDPASRLVIVKDSQGTTFDMVVTKTTQLRSADRPLRLKDLAADTNKTVSVRFVPERSGDIARSIKISG